MGVLMVSVVALLRLVSRVLSSAHRSSLISCARSARRRWRRAKTKTVQAGRKRRSAAASFNAKVPKKDVVNLSGLRTAPPQAAALIRCTFTLQTAAKAAFPHLHVCFMFFKISKNVVFLHIYRMKLSQSPSSFRSCQVTMAHFQLSLPVCDQLDALRQKVWRLWPRPDGAGAISVSFISPNTANRSAPRPRPRMAARVILRVDRLCLDCLFLSISVLSFVLTRPSHPSLL